MIIFGTKYKYKQLGKGKFLCPHCQTERIYERLQMTNYLALYFIPIFPIQKGQEIIRCTVCQNDFSLEVLKNQPAPASAQDYSLSDLINHLGTILRAGYPIDYAVRDLTKHGVERERAQEMIVQEIGSDTWQCDQCGLSYAKEVNTCYDCQSANSSTS